MRLIISLLTISTVFCSCADEEKKPLINQAKSPVLKFYNGPSDTLLTEGKLLNSWEIFKNALLKNDLEELKTLSTMCIACENCGMDAAIPIDIFFKNYFTHRFNDNLLSRMNDTAKVVGRYDEANWDIYSQNCIFKSSGLPKPRLAEIFVKISDPDSLYKGFEGSDAAIAFIETASGYKFCGYSTIP